MVDQQSQQKQFQRTHTTNINTLNKIVHKAMGANIEQQQTPAGSQMYKFELRRYHEQ
ncbi:hypothetical protein KSC_024520 [Ktedonobacter sp. SOSP1-52]|uniref:hypothetical protein n=1 Tax=Ktedonobacter sp. SOSP1-52 TaxID=2778366 RepID=UPI00191558B1|nr:hypothetical protein [Ktedonobacter sp. SOSP1-52]GHO63560.1 hypothetical protein KSC_024520 [Ktedonobacter sp. SOSP1-52]